MAERLAVDLAEAGEMLGVGRSTVHKMVRAGKLPHVRIGRRIIIPVKALKDWLEQQASESWASFDANIEPGMEPRA